MYVQHGPAKFLSVWASHDRGRLFNRPVSGTSEEKNVIGNSDKSKGNLPKEINIARQQYYKMYNKVKRKVFSANEGREEDSGVWDLLGMQQYRFYWRILLVKYSLSINYAS